MRACVCVYVGRCARVREEEREKGRERYFRHAVRAKIARVSWMLWRGRTRCDEAHPTRMLLTVHRNDDSFATARHFSMRQRQRARKEGYNQAVR